MGRSLFVGYFGSFAVGRLLYSLWIDRFVLVAVVWSLPVSYCGLIAM